MCRFPIYIKNGSRSFRDYCCPTQFVVPCGHCQDCRKSVRDDWFFRAFFEYKDCLKKGGIVYSILLTYDDEHLPYLVDTRFKEWKKFGYRVPCFSSAHLKSFRDKLRVYISRKYGPDAARGIRFFFVGEYGHKTGRSHYHVLIFLPFDLPRCQMLGTSHGKYTDGLFAKCWSYGFIGISKKHGPIVYNTNGVSYLMKYLQKPSKWNTRYCLDKYRDFLSEYVSAEEEPGEHTERYKSFLSSLPRHYQSQSFGACALKYFTHSDGTPCYDKFLSQYNLSRHGYIAQYNYNIPRYYYRKLFYSIDKVNDVAYLNEYGQIMKKKEFDVVLDRKYKSYEKYFHYGNFCSYCNSVPKDELLNFLHYRNCKNVRELYDKIFSVTLDRPKFDAKLLALYSLVYRFVNVKDYLFLKDEPYTSQCSYVIDNAFDLYQSRFAHNVYTVYPSGHQPALCDINFTNHSDFSSLPVFDSYDYTLMNLEQLLALVNHHREKLDVDKELLDYDLLYIYNPNPYTILKL